MKWAAGLAGLFGVLWLAWECFNAPFKDDKDDDA